VTGYGPGQLTALTLPVQDVGRSSRQVWIWLPPGVADSAALPVVYLLHGQDESPRTPFANGIANVLTRAFDAGAPPFELVVPDGVSAVRSDDEWADAWDGADSLETFVTQSTIAAAEGDLRRPRSLRAVAGFSMGAYGAAVMAARASGLFGQYVGLAGYYRRDDPQHALGSDATYRYVHTPVQRADQYGRTRVLLLDCTADAGSAVFAGELARMRAALARQGHPPGSDISAGTHSWTWADGQLPFVANFLAQGWGRG
jgi:S-formylglutathione hydrolase FrmB